MDNLLIIAIAVALTAILANLATSFGADTRDGFGSLERPGLA